MGTGSGAIVVSLALERPGWQCFATDIKAEALAVARQNCQHLQAEVLLSRCCWGAAFADHSFDVVVSNPPYVAEQDPHLSKLVYEPRSALTSGDSGLDDIRVLVDDAGRMLKPGGLLAFEHGYHQGTECRQLLQLNNFDRIETRKDLAGNERVSLGYAPD